MKAISAAILVLAGGMQIQSAALYSNAIQGIPTLILFVFGVIISIVGLIVWAKNVSRPEP